MQNTYVDFRAVKDAVSLRMALDHYGVNWLRKSGDDSAAAAQSTKARGRIPFTST